MDLSIVTGKIDSAYRAIRTLYEAERKLELADISNTLADALLDLSKAKMQIFELETKNTQLEERLRAIVQIQEDTEDLKLDITAKAYYRTPPRDSEFNGPFCKRCKKPMDRDWFQSNLYQCAFCGHYFTDS